jgi:DNA-directed RNA polymerase subunit RPC12/RpoP
MFDPEHQDIDCPKCLHRRVYFDREIGYYCMFCGHKFSTKEVIVLLEMMALTSRSIHNSGKSGKRPPPAIKELLPRKAKVEYISHDVTKRKKPVQESFDS